MPKTHSTASNCYDADTIYQGKKIIDKLELEKFTYYRWKEKAAALPELEALNIPERIFKNTPKRDRRKYCLTDAKAKKTEMHFYDQVAG